MKKELFSWRGAVALLIIAYMLLDIYGVSKEPSDALISQGVGALWLVLMFPPRMGKLLFLLPFTQKERMRYLVTYTLGYLLYYVSVFFVIGLISLLFSKESFAIWMRHFIIYTLPFILMYSGPVMDAMSASVRKPEAKKQKRFTTVVFLCALLPAIHCCGSYWPEELAKKMPGLLYACTFLAYACAVIVVGMYWRRISESLNQKGDNGKEERVCNS